MGEERTICSECLVLRGVVCVIHFTCSRLGFMALPVSTLMIWCVPRVRWSIPLVCLGATLLFVCLFLVKVSLQGVSHHTPTSFHLHHPHRLHRQPPDENPLVMS